MTLLYQSTRDQSNLATASQAVLQGLAADGGLFTLPFCPEVELPFEQLKDASYKEIAKRILTAFLDDFTDEELDSCIEKAYDDKFDDDRIAPLVKQGDQFYLELFHGPTIAFKDLALSILPHLLTTAAKKQEIKDKIAILTATSGDTGKAAMAGFAGVEGTEIIVFYPKDGVSKVQELQMTTQVGDNTHVVAIEGNFDDAQTRVKQLFNDATLKSELKERGVRFSSANSMNIGRLIPQIVYYVYAYAQLVKSGEITIGEKVNFTVPTGNFGNILAAYYAKKIGLPIGKLICASNENKVLTDFFHTRTYDKNRPFTVTTSPSMDILVSSNLERLIFHLLGNRADQTEALMKGLENQGKYEVPLTQVGDFDGFAADFATQEETKQEIKRVYDSAGYIIDPHTAVASAVYQKYRTKTKDTRKNVIVSTASPYKFPAVVAEAITGEKVQDDFAAFSTLYDLSNVPLPVAVRELQTARVRHQKVVAVSQMKETVKECLGVLSR